MATQPAKPPPPDRAPGSWARCLGRIGAAIALFALANLVLGVVLDRSLTRTGKDEDGVINNGRSARPEVLVLGSSRAKYHYDDQLLTELLAVRCFNAGCTGQGVPFFRVVLEQIAAVHEPRLVVIDVIAFAEDMEVVHALDPWYPRSAVLRELAADEQARKGAVSLAGAADADGDWRNRILMAIPAYRYAGRVWSTIKNGSRKRSEYGFKALLASSAAPENPPTLRPKRNEWFLPQLDALVSEAQSLGAQVVLAFSPIVNDAWGEVVVRPTLDYARAKNVPFLVYDREAYPVFKDPTLFWDREHLNSVGAEMFTRLLADELRTRLRDSASRPSSR